MSQVITPFRMHRLAPLNRGIFERLDKQIRRALPEARPVLASFYDWALEELDADRYAEIQARHIPDRDEKTAKFLAFTFWISRKMRVLCELGVGNSKRKRILDIGCGPGHALLIARFFDQEAHGLDLPAPECPTLYDDLCKFFGVSKLGHEIRAGERLPKMGRFDLVTSFLMQFDNLEGEEYWTPKQWAAFIKHVRADVLAPNGILYMDLTSAPKRSLEARAFLRGAAEWTDGRAIIIRA